MSVLATVVVVIPLITATGLIALERVLPQQIRHLVSLAVALAVAVLSGILLVHSAAHPILTWFGGWHPRGNIALGVDYVVEPLGAGLATLTGLLTAVALLYSRQYFGEVSGRYQGLVLVFAAGSVDFAFSGDLFNMFVAFELVAVTAFVLTGIYADKEAPLQGAINFAVTNTLGGLFVLTGLVLLYARTGSLNLAEMGAVLAGHRPDGLVVVAFALLSAGFLTKAAIVPFHFWLPDAYGTAPVPVCVLFAGVMSELGIFGLARVWSTVLSGAVGSPAEHRLQILFCALGVLTALVGTAMALVQEQPRRLLGFVTIAHTGIYLIGFGLLRAEALGAIAVLAFGDGLVKAALFLAAGILQHPHRPRSGRSRSQAFVVAAGVMALGALALADLPPFASAIGKDLLIASAGSSGWWVEAVIAVTVAGSSAAVLRSAANAWEGIASSATDARASRHHGESEADEDVLATVKSRLGLVNLVLPPVVLLLLALGLGLVPHLDQRAVGAAADFGDRARYADIVLRDHPVRTALLHVAPRSTWAFPVDLLEVGGTIGLGAALLVRRRPLRTLRSVGGRSIGWLRYLHSGHIGDQVTWQVVGVTILAGLGAVVLR